MNSHIALSAKYNYYYNYYYNECDLLSYIGGISYVIACFNQIFIVFWTGVTAPFMKQRYCHY